MIGDALIRGELDRTSINRLGLYLFFASESFLFAALISSRFYLLGIPESGHVNQLLGVVMTAALLLSSFTAHRGRAALARGDRPEFLRALTLTIVLGAAFLFGVGFEWAAADFAPADIWGTAFFSITGVHAAHVLSGVVILGLVVRLGRAGAFSAASSWGVEAATKYWAFVDAVWVFIYLSLYLLRAW